MKLVITLVCVHIPLFKVNIYIEFQVYMFSNGRDMTECQFLHDKQDDNNNAAAQTLAIPQVFSP